MLKLHGWSPLARGACYAALYATLTCGLAVVSGANYDSLLLMLVLLGGAVGFVGQEAIDGFSIHRKSPDWSRKDSVLFAFVMGVTFAFPLALGAVPEEDSMIKVLLTWGSAGAFFGTMMSFQMRVDYDEKLLAEGYDLTTSYVEKPGGKWVFYGNPVFTVLVVIGVLSYVDMNPSDSYFIWFFLIIMLSSLARFTVKGPIYASPRLYGLALLLIGLALNYASMSSTSA